MKRFKNILYVAESSAELDVFQSAIDLAIRNKARLTVVHAMEPIPSYLSRVAPHLLRQALIEETKEDLEKFRERGAGQLEIEIKIIEGSPFLEILREVLGNDHDLVIKTAEGAGNALERLFGTTDMHLIRKCPCPVWLLKQKEMSQMNRVMAAVDFDDLDTSDQDSCEPLNRMIVELAGSLAHLERGELHIVHAWSAPAEDMLGSPRVGLSKREAEEYVKEVRGLNEAWLKRLADKTKNWLGQDIYDSIKVKLNLPKGRAKVVVSQLAKDLDIDVLVMGTVGRTGISGLIIGNTAESIINQIDCSLLAVKPPGFVTPVTLEK